MNKFVAVLITAFLSLILGQASAYNTLTTSDQSLDSLNASLVCEKDKDKKKKKSDIPEEKEPECD